MPSCVACIQLKVWAAGALPLFPPQEVGGFGKGPSRLIYYLYELLWFWWRHSERIYRLKYEKVTKGAWRMPWLTEAMKDVTSCDKSGLGAHIR